MADLYSTLGVARGASEADIKKAYRKLAKELHPDRNKGNASASDRFSKVTQAYDILTDKDKRARYDRGEIDEDGNPRAPFGFGTGGPQPGSGGYSRSANGADFDFETGGETADLSDLFEGLFGGSSRRSRGFGGFGRRSAPPQRGADMAYRLDVPFEDAAGLKGQRVTMSSGKTLDIKLPKGVEDGARIRLAGQGEAGRRGQAGDLYLIVRFEKHPDYTIDGSDIIYDLEVPVWQAVLGDNLSIPTPDGPVRLKIPDCSQSGKKFRIKGRGLPTGATTRGDFYVRLVVQLPTDLTPEQRAQWEKLSRT